jgi:predicted acyltransferase
MLAIASSGLGIVGVVKNLRESRLLTPETQRIWEALQVQFTHSVWVGCTAWDLIQPSFMFLVGVSMAFSCAKRRARGQSYGSMLRHAMSRSAILVGLAIVLSSNGGAKMTNFTFANVLAQIGLGYTLLFLLWGRKSYELLATAIAILVAYWAIFASYPTPEPGFDYAAVGVTEPAERLPGFEAHWNKNANAASAVDRWLLNLFPREEKFAFNPGGYPTLNFIPSFATMIFGLMTGELLRSNRRAWSKVLLLALAGLMGWAAGWTIANCFHLPNDLRRLAGWSELEALRGIEEAGVCPLVKRIWTPSWAIFSAGWTCLLMAGFYLTMDVLQYRRWAYPLVVVGANPIAMYMMSQLIKPWMRSTLEIHWKGLAELLQLWPRLLGSWTEGRAVNVDVHINLPDRYTQLFPSPYAPMAEAVAVVLALWLICFWLYRQRVFIRI